jgi:hypothetical protein
MVKIRQMGDPQTRVGFAQPRQMNVRFRDFGI